MGPDVAREQLKAPNVAPMKVRAGNFEQVARVVWPLRLSAVARQLMNFVTQLCLAITILVAVITAGLTAVTGHPLLWSLIGLVFAAAPITGLVLALSVRYRAVLAAGPGWIGVRVVRKWRIVDLRKVIRVGVADPSPRSPFSPTALGGRALLLEDATGAQVRVDLDALGHGIDEILSEGLAPEASLDAEAYEILRPSDGHR